MTNERKDISYQTEHGYKLQTLIHKVNMLIYDNKDYMKSRMRENRTYGSVQCCQLKKNLV